VNEKLFDKCNFSTNVSEHTNIKISRSTSVSPQHFQDDKEDTIKYLKASFEEYKRKSQQTIRSLKRKIKQKKSEADFDIVIASLKSKLNTNYLHVLEQIGKSNKDLLKRMISKCDTKSINRQYSPELRSFALTLHYYSPKAYNYVREKFECGLEGNPGFNSEF